MIGFTTKNRKVQNLLRASKQDFAFDSENIRDRILLAAKSRHLSHDEARKLTLNPKTWPKYALGTGIACVVIAAGAGVSFASSQAKPGEALFPVQKLQNRLILSLPLPQTQKAEFSTHIVAKRLENLNEIAKDPNTDPGKLAAEVKEAQKSIDQAANFVQIGNQKHQEEPEDQDKPREKSQTLEHLVNRLDELTTKHQSQLQKIGNEVKDEDLKNKISETIEKISKTRERYLEYRKNNRK